MAEKETEKKEVPTRSGAKTVVCFDFERELRKNAAMKRGWNSDIREDSLRKLVEYSRVCDIVIRYAIPLTQPSDRGNRDIGRLREWLNSHRVPYERIEVYFTGSEYRTRG
jgi:hypothetical protein